MVVQQTVDSVVLTARQQVLVRPAVVSDAGRIAELVDLFARRGEMLPRSKHQICQHIASFVVAEVDGKIVGCGVLNVIWDDLAEIRTLAVSPRWQRQGIGSRLVANLIHQARTLELPLVFALTYVPAFFEHLGFRRIDRDTLPQKIWIDCINCPKYPDCDEEAVLLELGA